MNVHLGAICFTTLGSITERYEQTRVCSLHLAGKDLNVSEFEGLEGDREHQYRTREHEVEPQARSYRRGRLLTSLASSSIGFFFGGDLICLLIFVSFVFSCFSISVPPDEKDS